MDRTDRMERLKDDEDAVHDHLDELQAQRRAEWEAFAADPSQPVPQETGIDYAHGMLEATQDAIHELEGGEDDPADKKIFVWGTDNAWFGSGPAYDISFRSTQTGPLRQGFAHPGASPSPSLQCHLYGLRTHQLTVPKRIVLQATLRQEGTPPLLWHRLTPTHKMLVISRATAATTTLSPVAHASTRNQQLRTALAALPRSTSRVTLARVKV
ncbi:hypothetical protein LTR37_002838 [Vermiconidia calcicola]|uniref:Uncharacterized protein n=1 Tax=Vermiconidia calcicola TaxID=1690605 RepID=A0ACC3NRW4_9PEZI|nr:hypothetical protein LTR37_002838 [Vermiconidia calcicola]